MKIIKILMEMKLIMNLIKVKIMKKMKNKVLKALKMRLLKKKRKREK